MNETQKYVLVVAIATDVLNGDYSVENASRIVNERLAWRGTTVPLSEVIAC